MITQLKERKLSRGIDYLGELGAKLQDLTGYTTLACELIQNADDSKSATWIQFDVRKDCLVVDNDGKFSDCGSAEAIVCDWKTADGNMCDFHRFRTVASGDKRSEEGTTGAFGIGFTSVYQITDAPELISAGRHWILDENAVEDERITVCAGCKECRAEGLSRTRFILPWARNPESGLRTKLRVSVVKESDVVTLRGELSDSLASTLLFLNNLTKIGLSVEGVSLREFECLRDSEVKPNEIIIADQDLKNQIWRILYGDFDHKALDLRGKHGGKIEKKRKSAVMLAISADANSQGYFFATLPTQERTTFPFHINADFFTSNNRKRIVTGSDYQSEWNEAAIRAAASTLVSGFDSLKSFLSPLALWKIVESLKLAVTEASKGTIDASVGEFWPLFVDRVQEREIVYTSEGSWKTPPNVYLLERNEAAPLIPVCEGLGIVVVNESLRPFFTILRECGVKILDLPPLIKSFSDLGFNKPQDRKRLPAFVSQNLDLLWEEIDSMLRKKIKKEDRPTIESDLWTIAIAPTVSGSLAPICLSYRAAHETISVFESIGQGIEFLDASEVGFEPLKEHCPLFDLTAGLSFLERAGNETLAKMISDRLIDEVKIVEWFELRQAELQENEDLKERIASLSIFPCSTGVMPLNEQAIPGSFEDPIGVTHIVDIKRLGGKRDFLRLLAPQRELTFEKYVLEHLPEAFENPSTTDRQKEAAVNLLATHLGEIKDNYEAKQILASVHIARIEAGPYRLASEVYIKTKDTADVLGESVEFAVLPLIHTEAVRELLRWLGSHTRPQFPHITRRVKTIVSVARSPEADAQIERIFGYLVERLRIETSLPDLSELRQLDWLPEKRDRTRWAAPNDIYAIFQESIFSTQARFLMFPAPLQREASNLMEILGIRKTPEPRLVVDHLLHCSENNLPVKSDLYLYLDQHSDNAAIAELREKRCLYLQDRDKYARPTEVFWGQHPFGRLRYQLGNELRRYDKLFEVLKIKEIPDAVDARAVLMDISKELGFGNQQLDDEAYAIVMECWRLLSTGLQTNQIDEDDLASLKNIKVIPDPRKLLALPENIFFEERAGLASKFLGFLNYNVISRPQDGWRAMQVVGVRSLQEVVESSLVECDDPLPGHDLIDLLKNRRLQIERIIASQTLLEGEKPNGAILDSLQIISVRSLRVVYTLNAFRQERQSEPERIDALYMVDDNILYFTRTDGTKPWASIAKELALAISPSAEPGRLSPGIFHVLVAGTDEAASTILDQLGYPTLQASTPTVTGTQTVANIGTEGSPWEDGVSPGGTATTGTVEGETTMTPEQAARGILGLGTQPPTPMPPGTGGDELPTGTATGQGSGGKKTQRTERLLSYVSNGEGTNDGNENLHTERNTLANKGVERVVEYEKKGGRIAEIMPPFNEGYDVISRDEKGNIVRYIEVKSLSGVWGSVGVGVTKPQFDFSRDNGSETWLYVVERALDDDYQIHLINNPACRVTKYMFDSGWKAAANEVSEINGAKENKLEMKRTTNAQD